MYVMSKLNKNLVKRILVRENVSINYYLYNGMAVNKNVV